MNLPDLIKLENFGDDFQLFEEEVYKAFKECFIDNRPSYRGCRVGLKRMPLRNGREATYYHMVTEGEDENNRSFAKDRMERIRWPAFIIDNSTDNVLYVWNNIRSGQLNILMYHHKESYLVVLRIRKDYLLPWTAYPVTKKHTRDKLLKEYQLSKNAEAAT